MDPSQKPADLDLHCFKNRIYLVGSVVVLFFIAACIVCRSFVFGPCFVMQYLMFLLVLQSS